MPKTFDEWVGFRIIVMRTLKRLTQVDLADACLVPLRDVVHWESGTKSVKAQDLARLSVALDTSPNHLLGFKGDPSDLEHDHG